jgi:predicted ATP-binding protein involved in virulence
MKNLSDEELVLNYCISCMEFDRDTDVPPEGVKKNMLLQKELLSRLARGRKAIEFANALIKHRENGADLEKDGLIYNLIEEYQKLGCK